MFGVYGFNSNPYVQRRSSYTGIQGSWTSQVSTHHLLKAGGEFQRHSLRLINFSNPASFGGPNPDYSDIDGYGYRPVIVRDASGRISSVKLET